MPQESGTQDGQAQAIRNELDDELLESAADADVDVDATIQQKIVKHGDYPTNVIANFVRSDITNQIETANAETLKGIIAGSRDRNNSNGPRRHSLIRSSGEHVEVSTWDGALPGPQGEEVTIPSGNAVVEFECDYEEQYDSYQGVGIAGIDEIGVEEMAESLGKVAIPPSDLTHGDQYEIVVVEGTISYIDTQSIFTKDAEGNWEIDREGEVLMEDKRGDLQPHLEMSLAKDEITSLRGHVEHQGYGKPFFAVPGLSELVTDAYREFDEPGDQANFVRNGLQGTDVIMVGNVNEFNTHTGDDGEPTNYVDLSLSAVVAKDVSGGVGASEDEQEPADEAGEPDEETEVEDEPAEEPDEEADEGVEEPAEDAPDVEQVAADIEQYASLVGEDVDGITAKDIVENAKGIEAPESVIDHALRMLSDDEDADDGDEDDPAGGAETGDRMSLEQQFASLEKSGMYQCPVNGCPGKGSSIADLIPHVIDEHEVDSASGAKDWLAERV